jgi:glycine/D-amino acid oxidase-like deaminating enzyme
MNARSVFESVKLHGREKKPLPESYLNLWKKTTHGIELMEEIAKRHQIRCGLAKEGSLKLAVSQKDSESMSRYAEKASELGITVRFLDSKEYRKMIDAEGYCGALHYPDDRHINSAQYLSGLAGAIKEKGVDLYEESPVFEIGEGRRCSLLTPRGQVVAETVVLAANAYTTRLGYFRNRITPILRQMAVTGPLDPEKIERMGWHFTRYLQDSSTRAWSMGITEDYRIIVGGGRHDYRYGRKTSYSQAWLSRCMPLFPSKFSKTFPAAVDVEFECSWAGAIDACLEMNPAIGVTGKHRNIFYGIGYCGHGINLAHLSGKIIADLYADNPEPWRDLPFFNWTPLLLPPDPFKYIALKPALEVMGLMAR